MAKTIVTSQSDPLRAAAEATIPVAGTPSPVTTPPAAAALTDKTVAALTAALTRLSDVTSGLVPPSAHVATPIETHAAAEFQRIRAELKTNFELF